MLSLFTRLESDTAVTSHWHSYYSDDAAEVLGILAQAFGVRNASMPHV